MENDEIVDAASPMLENPISPDLAVPDIEHWRTVPPKVAAAVAEFVAEFNAASRKSSEGIVEMAATVFKAWQTLDDGYQSPDGPKHVEFELFCRNIRYDPDSSSIRKLLRIGRMAEMLKNHTDQLPNTWTTLYTLTQLGSEALERLIKEHRVVATTTFKEASELLLREKGMAPGVKKDRTIANFGYYNQPVKQRAKSPALVANHNLVIRFPVTPTADQVLKVEEAIRSILVKMQPDAQVSRSAELDALMNESFHPIATPA